MWKYFTFTAIIYCLFINCSAQVLRGVTIKHKPWAEQRNGKIVGFANDLVKEIANIGHFNYTLEFTPDGKYGVIVNNTINGMIGEVNQNRADFAVADITVTDARKEYIDFTEPIIETGVVILVNKNNVNNIKSFEDLAEQTDINYGTILMGSSYYQFSQSTDPVLQKMYQFMINNPSNLMTNTKDGLEKVKTSNYAFIIEKTSAEYITGMDCDLTFIEDQNNQFSRQYAIALPKNSTYLDQFNAAIRELKSTGMLNRMRNKYWKKCGVLNGVTIVNPPFTELGADEKLGGFGIDLINEIAKMNNFQYNIDLTPDGYYGVLDQTTGQMNGMVGEVQSNRADFAIADLTITDLRKRYVDFTEPFIETGLVLLIHKNHANNIQTFSQLAEESDIKVGLLNGGSTYHRFNTSTDPTIKKLFDKMKENPEESFMTRLTNGVQKVKTGVPFAFVVEKTYAEYVTGKDCDLTFIEDPAQKHPIQFAIALPKDSQYLDRFNYAIAEMKSSNFIQNLRNRYWKKCGVLSGVTIRRWPIAELFFDKMEGVVSDLINEISTIGGFNYSLYFTPDEKYGYLENGKWNGMIGEVVDQRADFAVADLTVNDIRKQYVDFTEPFMETRLAILIHKMYSNNITSFADLADQTAVRYGLLKMGSTNLLFNQSTDPILQKMYQQMTENPDVLVMSIKDGMKRVKRQPFALIVEKSTAEFITGRDCNLTFIEDQQNHETRQYAIALPKGSPHLETFNTAIRQLKSTGGIDTILHKYWRQCNVLRGVTINSQPYAMSPESGDQITSGYVVDLMAEISALNGWNYTLEFVPDGRYGTLRYGIPNGMIGVVNKTMADFAAADLTVTEWRKNFVDFTEPIIETGLSILIHKDLAANITSFSDLSERSDLKYGLISMGSTFMLFAESNDPLLVKMFDKMSETPEVFISNIWDGIEKVRTTPFAFIVERAYAEYITGQDCNLTFIDDPNNRFPRQYAIALPKGSAYRQAFNSAINTLKSNGSLDRLRDKYWKKCEQ